MFHKQHIQSFLQKGKGIDWVFRVLWVGGPAIQILFQSRKKNHLILADGASIEVIDMFDGNEVGNDEASVEEKSSLQALVRRPVYV